LRRQVERLLTDIRETDRRESLREPACVLGVRLRPDNPAPELRVAMVAVIARNGGLRVDVGLQVRAVNRLIRAVGGATLPVWKGRKPENDDRRRNARQDHGCSHRRLLSRRILTYQNLTPPATRTWWSAV